MSQKPVCVKCACYYRMAKSGVWYVEMMPINNEAPRGNRDPGQWKPYKIWHADLWACPECGHQIISGSGLRPVSEKHMREFKDWLKNLIGTGRLLMYVNDC